MNNPVVVNPERNPDLASFLEDELGNFKPSYRMDRDNCGFINRELRTEIIVKTGEEPSYVYGLFRVDSYRNWLDPEDFTDEELCLLYTSPSPRDPKTSRMPSSA